MSRSGSIADHFHEVFNSLILISNVNDHDHFKGVVRNEETFLVVVRN